MVEHVSHGMAIGYLGRIEDMPAVAARAILRLRCLQPAATDR